MFGPSLIIDHPYIDDHNIAERFVRGELPKRDRDSFARHYVDCPECRDRVALAQIFHVETQTQAARKNARPAVPAAGIFTVLASFTPRQQGAIFAVTALLLLLMPVFAMNWFDNHPNVPQAEVEPVIWLSRPGPVEAQIPSGASGFTITAAFPDPAGTYRLNIVDVTDRALLTGPDQLASRGLALGLRLTSLPAGVTVAVVEKKAQNGAYTIVSRHPLVIGWR